MKNNYIELIEKIANDQTDNKTRFIGDRIKPALKRTLLPQMAGGLVAGLAGAGLGSKLSPKAVSSLGYGIVGATGAAKMNTTKNKFEEKELKPGTLDYLMAGAVPLSSPESRLKRRLRKESRLAELAEMNSRNSTDERN